MRIHGYQLYPLIAVAMLAAATTWLERITRNDTPESGAATARHDPDTIVSRTHMLSYDRNGTLIRILDAEELRHFPDDGSGELTHPRLEVIGANRTVYLEAAHGIVQADGDRVDLDGEVRGRSESGANTVPVQLRTETLTIWPDSQRAVSHSPTTLIQGTNTVSGLSMQADNLFGTLIVTGSVRATIKRNPAP